MADEIKDKSLICPAHIDLVVELTKIGTIQGQLVENQRKMNCKLDDIKDQLVSSKYVALSDRASTTREIELDRTKIKPVYWIMGVMAIAGLSEVVKWFWHLITRK
jgi:hypothetical protein